MNPKVSVIIPVYNSEKYIKKCIESIRIQTLKEIEIVLVDDGSIDKSGEICDYYSRLDNRIVAIHIKNNGVSNARNTGIKFAKGKYIMFSDSDDYVDDRWCETLYNIAEENEDDFILCGYEIISSRNSKSNRKQILSPLKDESIILDRKDFFNLYNWNLLNSPCNKIFNRNKINKHNISYIKTLSLGEDMIFNLDYLEKCSGSIRITNEALYYYSQDDRESLDNRYYDNLFRIYKILFKKIKSTIDILETNYEVYKDDINLAFFYLIEKSLNNTFNKKNKDNLINKIKYNNSILKSKEVRSCILNLGNSSLRKSYIYLWKKENYIYVMIYNKILSSLYTLKKGVLNSIRRKNE